MWLTNSGLGQHTSAFGQHTPVVTMLAQSLTVFYIPNRRQQTFISLECPIQDKKVSDSISGSTYKPKLFS